MTISNITLQVSLRFKQFGIEGAKEKAKETINNAIEYLSVYKDNEAKLLLIELAKYIIERKS